LNILSCYQKVTQSRFIVLVHTGHPAILLSGRSTSHSESKPVIWPVSYVCHVSGRCYSIWCFWRWGCWPRGWRWLPVNRLEHFHITDRPDLFPDHFRYIFHTSTGFYPLRLVLPSLFMCCANL